LYFELSFFFIFQLTTSQYVLSNDFRYYAVKYCAHKAYNIVLAFTLAMLSPRPSVCRLSSVTFVHPTRAIKIFGNVLRHLVPWPSLTFR